MAAVALNTAFIPQEFKEEESDPDSLAIKEVATRILGVERQDWEECGFPWDQDRETKKLAELAKLEADLREQRSHLPKGWDSYEPAGGLQWSMSLGNIHSHVQKKFEDLRKSGILLFRSEFERREDREKFRPAGRIYRAGQRNNDLTRIWGAEYLRKKLEEEELYRVPRFILIVEDRVKSLSVKLWDGGSKSLFITSIEPDQGEIVVENVSRGKPDAWSAKHKWLLRLGYVDFSDPGNILQGEDGKYYIVDTEWKSLDGVLERSGEPRKIGLLREYAATRFHAFNSWLSKTIPVQLRPS